MEARRFIVAGNGPSAALTPLDMIRPDDFVIRVNNFFLEPSYYLGARVDLAFMGGDPFVAPLMFETLNRCKGAYDLSSWSTHNPKIKPIGQRVLRTDFMPMRYHDQALEADVHTLIKRFQKHPMTGTYAVLMAYGLGAREIVLTGFDFYQSSQRYCYHPGANLRMLLGDDIATRGVDFRLHDPKLDLEILTLLAEKRGVNLLRAGDMPWLRDIARPLPSRKRRIAKQAIPKRTKAPLDWAPSSGLRHVKLLKSLLWGRQQLRRLAGV